MKFKVGCSPLNGDIYAGNVSNKNIWGTKKHLVTNMAIESVALCLIIKNKTFQFEYQGKKYEMKVTKRTKGE